MQQSTTIITGMADNEIAASGRGMGTPKGLGDARSLANRGGGMKDGVEVPSVPAVSGRPYRRLGSATCHPEVLRRASRSKPKAFRSLDRLRDGREVLRWRSG